MATQTRYPQWLIEATENRDTSPEYEHELTVACAFMIGFVPVLETINVCGRREVIGVDLLELRQM